MRRLAGRILAAAGSSIIRSTQLLCGHPAAYIDTLEGRTTAGVALPSIEVAYCPTCHQILQ